jgi:serine/threonine protein kinase
VSAIPLRRIEGKYEILEKLGEGGMGAVYKVRHRLLDEIRVVKMMRPQLVSDEEFKARFQREARVAIKLRHPNVAQLYDFTIDETDGTAFIVMEFINGMTLEEVLRNGGPTPLGLTLEIAQQSLRALGFLHAKGFVHRDISPDNLMLTRDPDGEPQVKMIDLGIAKVTTAGAEVSNLTGTGIFLGKVRYSPPEQFGTEGAAMVDARGDLYSFGLVLYELLTGRYPIQGRDPSSLIAGHLLRPPLGFEETDPAGRIPRELRALVMKALEKKPEDRFASAQELERALASLRTSGDVAAGDLDRALTRIPSGTIRMPMPDPGSTQGRLDYQFGLRTTPSRAADRTLTPSARRRGIGSALSAIEQHMGRGDFLTAETELEWAVDTFGDLPELRDLRRRLQERRSRELELRVQTLLREAGGLFGDREFEGALERLHRARALSPANREVLDLLKRTEEARQRAAEEQREARDVAGVVTGIEAALARSDARAAEVLLYQAEATYGEREVFSDLHQRLMDLRRQTLEARRRVERQAEAAALAEKAARRRDEGDLPGALEEARGALGLDADNAPARALVQEVEAELARREQEARRANELAEAVAAIEARLGKGDLGRAGDLLAEAATLFGDEDVLRDLRVRLEDLRRAARDAAIAGLLASAGRLRTSGDLDGALKEARQALALDGESAPARALIEEVEAERRRREEQALREAREVEIADLLASAGRLRAAGDLDGALVEARRVLALEKGNADARGLIVDVEAEQRRQAEEARRTAELAAAIASIEARLGEGDLNKAADLLDDSVSLFGGEGALRDLRARLEDLRRRARETEIAGLLASAGRLRGAGELEGALAEARRALALDGQNASAWALVEEIEAERRQRQEEARRTRQLTAALESIDACLEREDPEAAARLLPGILAIFGDVAELRERWERIEELRRRKLEERIAALLEEAHRMEGEGKLAEALTPLREAGRLAPESADVQALAQRFEAEIRRREEEHRKEAELAGAMAAIDQCLERGDAAAAARLLPGAVAAFGGVPVLRERWEKLEVLQRKSKAEALRKEAETLLQAGHADRAERKLRQAQELDPG